MRLGGGLYGRWRALVMGGTNYFSEVRLHSRPLLAAMIGLGSGLSFTVATASIMGPHLIEEFGWSRADFAAVSSLVLVSVISIPIIGRLADLIGVRRTAFMGVATLPLSFVVLSAMRGDMGTYVAVIFFQTVICGATTATVYSRVVVQHIDKARGLALAIVTSGPAISAAIGGPMLNELVEAQGWRAGYIALAVFTALGGTLALLMMPAQRKSAAPAPKSQIRRTKEDYALIAKRRAFWILLVAMLLCNLPHVIALSQLNLVMLENGVATADASVMFSAFATGSLAGRFLCGLAIDRFSPPKVAAISMGLPSVGLMLLASSFDAPVILAMAIFIMGLSYGAEGDLLGFLVSREFEVRLYSTVMGLVSASIGLSIALGAMAVSLFLRLTGAFTPFVLVCAVSVVIGGSLLLLLQKKTAPMPVKADAASLRASSAE
jgi:predicted MFS family arabinose efflux permease